MGRIALAVAVFAAAVLAGLGVGRTSDPTPSEDVQVVSAEG